MTWFKLPIAVMMVLRQGGQVLLGCRQNTGFKDGHFALPGGKHDGDEPLTHSVIREANEELGIICTPEDLRLSTIIHVKLVEPKLELLYVTFEIIRYQGKIINNEPEKCSELQFFPVDQLPDLITDVSRRCVFNTLNAIPFDEMGWDEPIDTSN